MAESWDALEFVVDSNTGNPNAVAFISGSFLFMRLPGEHVLISIGGNLFSRQWFPEIDGNDIRLSVYCPVKSDGVQVTDACARFMEEHGTKPAVLRGREMFRLHDTFGLRPEMQEMVLEETMRKIRNMERG